VRAALDGALLGFGEPPLPQTPNAAASVGSS
jgi:hypothetical protein